MNENMTYPHTVGGEGSRIIHQLNSISTPTVQQKVDFYKYNDMHLFQTEQVHYNFINPAHSIQNKLNLYCFMNLLDNSSNFSPHLLSFIVVVHQKGQQTFLLPQLLIRKMQEVLPPNAYYRSSAQNS